MSSSAAGHIREKYMQLRRRSQQGYSPNEKQDIHWQRAAQLAERLGADPRLFIEAQFALGVGGGEFPYPNMLYGPKAEANWQNYHTSFKPACEEQLQNQFRYLLNAVQRCGCTVDEAARDSIRNFKPWFRMFVCSEKILPELEEKYGEAARIILRVNPDLQDHLLKSNEHRTRSILRQVVSGELHCQHSPPPPPSYPDRERQTLRGGL